MNNNIIFLIKLTTAQNEGALNYHRVRRLYLLAVIFEVTLEYTFYNLLLDKCYEPSIEVSIRAYVLWELVYFYKSLRSFSILRLSFSHSLSLSLSLAYSVSTSLFLFISIRLSLYLVCTLFFVKPYDIWHC